MQSEYEIKFGQEYQNQVGNFEARLKQAYQENE